MQEEEKVPEEKVYDDEEEEIKEFEEEPDVSVPQHDPEELAKLLASSQSVINLLEDMLHRHGVPDHLIVQQLKSAGFCSQCYSLKSDQLCNCE